MTQEKLVDELDRVVRVPGLTNIWIPPIRNRIDMLATGIKSPIGICGYSLHPHQSPPLNKRLSKIHKCSVWLVCNVSAQSLEPLRLMGRSTKILTRACK